MRFRAGLEIHQQLATSKLFCPCPSVIRREKPDIKIERELRPLAGETGEIDIAALFEKLKGKRFVYEAYSDSNCLVELDEEPPHLINQRALQIALRIAKALNCEIPPVLQVMRKTVVDGSNTSGFQRTVLVGLNGWIETSFGKVGITNVCLEEDSARRIAEDDKTVTFRLDRLGIPLVEIGTTPDCKSPEQVRELAEKIGLLLRMSGEVARGLGTIRQDVNVSIPGGARVEIKGAQDLAALPKLVETEAKRQSMLIEVAKELKSRKARADSQIFDVSEIFVNTACKILRGKKVFAIRLIGFRGLLKGKLGPELAGYAKVLAGVKGLFHTDELPAYGISQSEVDQLSKKLKLGKQDAFVIIADEPERAKAGLRAVAERANAALKGVPKEVRKANPDGSSSFLRPMPGAARMYPETDHPLIYIDEKMLAQLAPIIPFERKVASLVKIGLSQDLAEQIVRSPRLPLFEQLIDKFKKVKPSLIANTLLSAESEVRKKIGKEITFADEQFAAVLGLLDQGKIVKEALLEIFIGLARGEKLSELAKRFKKLSDAELKAQIAKLKKELAHLPPEKLRGAIIGKLRGKAEVEKILKFLK